MQRPLPESIPLTPGVYLYKDETGRIIYVGKARILRRRVLSYFRDDVPIKTRAMLSHADSLSFISTTTEKEALLLEAGLIKKHRPRYNIVLRDDKQYVLFRIAVKSAYPRLEIVRRTRRDGGRYFGPFTSALAARETWKLIHRFFGLRRCTDRVMKNRVRPCLYHHLGQCPAPCTNKVDPHDYNETVRRVIDLLSGNTPPLLEELKRDMEAASGALEFERAAVLRDQIRAVRATVEQQAAVLPGGGDMDVTGLAAGEKGLALGLLLVRGGAITDARAFYWPGLNIEDAPEVMLSFTAQYYMDNLPPPRILFPWLPQLPAEKEENGTPLLLSENISTAGGTFRVCSASALLSPENTAGGRDSAPGASPVKSSDIPASSGQFSLDSDDAAEHKKRLSAETPEPETAADRQDSAPGAEDSGEDPITLLESALSERRGSPVRIVIPRDSTTNQLVDVACANAREEISRRRESNVAEKLQRLFALPEPPQRIECVDVSHTGGRQTRVGLVVFEDGKPAPDQYRLYSMPDDPALAGGDDYGTLAAWVARRLDSGEPWPDLLLIDGGRGQISAVSRALAEAGRPGFFHLAGIAKARDDQGHADRRAGNVADRIFVPERSNPLPFREGSPELLFLQHIRDCTHHFAISGHRRARSGAALSSELMRLPGIGPATARLLWDHFGSLEAMRTASLEQLAQIPGIGQAKARTLKKRLSELG